VPYQVQKNGILFFAYAHWCTLRAGVHRIGEMLEIAQSQH
jgi:hypothetical protein